MLKILRFDFYKLIKSWRFRVFFIISVLCCFIMPIENIVTKSEYSIFEHIYGSADFWLNILVIVFAFLLGSDIATEYIKNISNKTKRCYYVLSKIIYLVAYIVLFNALAFVIEIIFNKSFGTGVFIEETDFRRFSVASFWQDMCMFMLITLVKGLIVLSFMWTTKRNYIVLIVVLVYALVLNGICMNFLEKIFKTSAIRNYAVFTNAYPCKYKWGISDPVAAMIIYLGYSIISFFVSWLAIAKKNI